MRSRATKEIGQHRQMLAHKNDKQFAEIVDIVPDHRLVFNESRVSDARVWMNGRVEVLFLSYSRKRDTSLWRRAAMEIDGKTKTRFDGIYSRTAQVH